MADWPALIGIGGLNLLLPEHREKFIEQYDAYCQLYPRAADEDDLNYFLKWIEQSWEGQQMIIKLYMELIFKTVYDLRKVKKNFR